MSNKILLAVVVAIAAFVVGINVGVVVGEVVGVKRAVVLYDQALAECEAKNKAIAGIQQHKQATKQKQHQLLANEGQKTKAQCL